MNDTQTRKEPVVLKVIIGSVAHNRRTGETKYELIDEEELAYREEKAHLQYEKYNAKPKKDRKKRKKRKWHRKGCMGGRWLKNMYGQ